MLWKIEEIKNENNNELVRLVNKNGKVFDNQSSKGNNGKNRYKNWRDPEYPTRRAIHTSSGTSIQSSCCCQETHRKGCFALHR